MLLAVAAIVLAGLFTDGHQHAHNHSHAHAHAHAHASGGHRNVEPVDHAVVIENFDGTTRWFTVNDTVMGGRSSGGPAMHEGVLTFSGTINTNGGGFSSIRARAGDLSDYDALRLRVRGDGRAYRVSLRTDARVRGREIAYQAEFRAPSDTEWTEITLPFDTFEPTWRGNDMTRFAPDLDVSKTRQMGIILGDGIDGPFHLEIDRIEGISATAPAPDRSPEAIAERYADLFEALARSNAAPEPKPEPKLDASLHTSRAHRASPQSIARSTTAADVPVEALKDPETRLFVVLEQLGVR
jgi:NADH dehydrogenase [ubiquinone] 1 alpha subcomplex assembly factor 1